MYSVSTSTKNKQLDIVGVACPLLDEVILRRECGLGLWFWLLSQAVDGGKQRVVGIDRLLGFEPQFRRLPQRLPYRESLLLCDLPQPLVLFVRKR